MLRKKKSKAVQPAEHKCKYDNTFYSEIYKCVISSCNCGDYKFRYVQKTCDHDYEILKEYKYKNKHDENKCIEYSVILLKCSKCNYITKMEMR